MNIILLSGGSGKRLWPLSNDVRSKQITTVDADAKITIATSKSQAIVGDNRK